MIAHLNIKVRTSACIEPLNHPLRQFQPAKKAIELQDEEIENTFE